MCYAKSPASDIGTRVCSVKSRLEVLEEKQGHEVELFDCWKAQRLVQVCTLQEDLRTVRHRNTEREWREYGTPTCRVT